MFNYKSPSPTYKSPGDFLKNASEKEKKTLFLKVAKQANKDQRKIMNNYLRTKGTPMKQGKTTCSDDKIKDIEELTNFLEIPSVDWVRLQPDTLEYINKREKTNVEPDNLDSDLEEFDETFGHSAVEVSFKSWEHCDKVRKWIENKFRKREKTARKAGFDDATSIWAGKNMEKGLVLSKMISVALDKQKEEIVEMIKQYLLENHDHYGDFPFKKGAPYIQSMDFERFIIKKLK